MKSLVNLPSGSFQLPTKNAISRSLPPPGPPNTENYSFLSAFRSGLITRALPRCYKELHFAARRLYFKIYFTVDSKLRSILRRHPRAHTHMYTPTRERGSITGSLIIFHGLRVVTRSLFTPAPSPNFSKRVAFRRRVVKIRARGLPFQ